MRVHGSTRGSSRLLAVPAAVSTWECAPTMKRPSNSGRRTSEMVTASKPMFIPDVASSKPKRHSVVMGAVDAEKPHTRAAIQNTLRRRHSTLGVDPTALDRIITDATVVGDSHNDDEGNDPSSRLFVLVLILLVVAGGTGTNVAFDMLNKVSFLSLPCPPCCILAHVRTLRARDY